jgi:hypothetical protein
VKTVFVSPSDINYTYDRCQRCWYRKINKLQKPKEALPAVFQRIDGGMKECYDVAVLRSFGIPAQSLLQFEWVQSKPIEFEEYGVQLVIRGKMDKAAVLDDGSCGIAEFKTSEFTDRKVRGFSRQVHAYEIALRTPERGLPLDVSRMDLIFFQPYEQGTFRVKPHGEKMIGSLMGELIHREIPIDRSEFETFLGGMAKVAGGAIPDAGAQCEYCMSVADASRYDDSRRIA